MNPTVSSSEFTFAAVLVAPSATPDDARELDAMVRAAHEAGAAPIVIAIPRGVAPPAGVRVAHIAAGTKAISGIRAGMALLANSSVQFALVWPHDRGWSETDGIAPLVDAVRRERAALTALAGSALDAAPIIVARDCWLELMTVGEQGMDALAARRGVHRVQN